MNIIEEINIQCCINLLLPFFPSEEGVVDTKCSEAQKLAVT